MRRIVFALVAAVALAGMVAYMAPASGQVTAPKVVVKSRSIIVPYFQQEVHR
jgi:hypothetical protein